MRKLRLDVNALVVESFGTAADAAGPGTVHGARAVLDGSGGSDCDVCWSADPCTNIPVETCTCGCDGGTTVPQPVHPDAPPLPATGCAATSVCTCTPIETCSCAPGYV